VRPVDVKKIKFKDNLASKRRQRSYVTAGIIVTLVLGVIIGSGYVLFYAPWLKINTIAFEGLMDSHEEEVGRAVEEYLDHKILGIPVYRDIFFVRSGSLEDRLSSRFSFIESVSVEKDYPHALKITAIERQAEGVWCFGSDSISTTPNCKYFDQEGVMFGQAIQSSGVLLLNVDDMRVQSASASSVLVDQAFLKGIQTVTSILAEQKVKIKNITIPLGTYTEFDVLVGEGYIVKFSLDSDIKNQLDVFRIFKDQKITKGALSPQYIDLRFDGRVYYK
jgi:hypothetical protein